MEGSILHRLRAGSHFMLLRAWFEGSSVFTSSSWRDEQWTMNNELRSMNRELRSENNGRQFRILIFWEETEKFDDLKICKVFHFSTRKLSNEKEENLIVSDPVDESLRMNSSSNVQQHEGSLYRLYGVVELLQVVGWTVWVHVRGRYLEETRFIINEL